MKPSEMKDLRKFLGTKALDLGCGLYLPQFAGPVELIASPGADPSLRYPGNTFADRDARAAFYVTSVLGLVLDPDKIHMEEASAFFKSSMQARQTAFLFGSRSNQASKWATKTLAEEKFFSFNFESNWQIRFKNGQVFSLPDPSTLDRESYEKETDYGVIARLSTPQSDFFLIAGLGSRATEGCGYYFSRHWRDLFQKFGENDFAVILRFPPPLNPRKSEPASFLGKVVKPVSLPAMDDRAGNEAPF